MNFTKTIIEAIKHWVNGNFVGHSKQNLTDEQQEQVRVNLGETADKALELAYDLELVDPIADSDGVILTDENDNIISD